MQFKNSYSADEMGQINAYSVQGETLKDLFLNDALSMARMVARELKKRGWDSKSRKNKGGIAVSGEVYCDLIPPTGDYQFLVEFGSTAFRSGGMLAREHDGVMIMVQKRSRDDRRSIIGNNIYIDPSYTSEQVAAEILRIWHSGK